METQHIYITFQNFDPVWQAYANYVYECSAFKYYFVR